MSGYYKSRHRHRLAVSPKRGVSSYFFTRKKTTKCFSREKAVYEIFWHASPKRMQACETN